MCLETSHISSLFKFLPWSTSFIFPHSLFTPSIIYCSYSHVHLSHISLVTSFFCFIFFYSILILNPSNNCKTISKCPHQICKYYFLPIVSGKGGEAGYSHPVNKQRVKLAIQKKKWRMNKQLYLQLGSSTIFFFNSILPKLNRKN